MKQGLVAGIFSIFGILLFISSTESLSFYDGLSNTLKSLKEFFTGKDSDSDEGSTGDDVEPREHGGRVKRWIRFRPFWKSFFIKFWKALQRMPHPHFYQSWRPVPFVPVRPTTHAPLPTTPGDEPLDANSTGASSAAHVTGHDGHHVTDSGHGVTVATDTKAEANDKPAASAAHPATTASPS